MTYSRRSLSRGCRRLLLLTSSLALLGADGACAPDAPISTLDSLQARLEAAEQALCRAYEAEHVNPPTIGEFSCP